MKFTANEIFSYFESKRFPLVRQHHVVKQKYEEYAKEIGSKTPFKEQTFFVVEVFEHYNRPGRSDHKFFDGKNPEADIAEAEELSFGKTRDFNTISKSIRDLGLQESRCALLYDYNHVTAMHKQDKGYIVVVESWSFFLVLFEESFYNLLKISAKQNQEDNAMGLDSLYTLADTDMLFEFQLKTEY